MAQTMTGTAIGRVNRRFLFLALVLAVLAGVLAYAAFSKSGGGGSGTAGGDASVEVARAAIPAGTQITADMLELRELPANALGERPITTIEGAIGQTARYPIAANEQLLSSKIVGGIEIATNDVIANIIESGRRGLAIKAEAVIGAGGLVLPGDRVDVYWVPKNPIGDVPGAQLIAENVEVLAVETTLEDVPVSAPRAIDETQTDANGARVPSGEPDILPEAVTVTLMLSPDQIQRVFCGEETGVLRLAIRAFGDDSASGLEVADCVIAGRDIGIQ